MKREGATPGQEVAHSTQKIAGILVLSINLRSRVRKARHTPATSSTGRSTSLASACSCSPSTTPSPAPAWVYTTTHRTSSTAPTEAKSLPSSSRRKTTRQRQSREGWWLTNTPASETLTEAGLRGGISDGVVAIDEDREDAFEKCAADQGVEIPPTFTVKTAKGRHCSFLDTENGALGNHKSVLELRNQCPQW